MARSRSPKLLPSMGMGVLARILTLVALVTASTALAGYEPTASERLAEQIREGIADGGAGAERSLMALRELRDPALRPLFSQLAAGPGAELRRNGVLGRAELDSPAKLDPFLLMQIVSPEERLSIVEAARRQGLLSDDSVRDLLARSDLSPAMEIYLRLAAAGAGDPVDAERAAALLAGSIAHLPTEARAALLVMEASPAETMPEPLPLLISEDTPLSRAALVTILNDAARLRLRGSAPLAEAVLAASGEDALLRAAAIDVLLAVAPERATSAWTNAFEADSAEYADRLRLALLAIEARDATDEVLERLGASNDALLGALGRAALGIRQNDPAPILALIETRYTQALAWLVRQTKVMEPSTAERTLLAIIDLTPDLPAGNWELADQPVRAAEALAALRPEAYLERFRRAVDQRDLRTEQAMLLGALRPQGAAVCPGVLAAASTNPECQALAAIAAARSAEGDQAASLTELLRAIAAGEGGLHPARRVQAAWLALRLSGEERLALARILAPAPS